MREMVKKGEGAGGSSGYARPKNLCQYLFGLCRRLFKSRHKLHMSEESCALLVERLEGGKRRNQGGLGAWQETDVCFVWPIPFAFLTAAQVFLLMYFYCFLPTPRPLYAFSCLFCLCLLAVSLLSVYKYKRLCRLCLFNLSF